ncbi:hypothetical protein K443DRAFT_5911 [Laccaria amethystina LaAM-08-1]|uniref:Uncharacterized protein n=1 Tax=Laccaria amethystina LaAM-08-1 TaxID=1095629 RepID=A0A0C9Y3T3_9AGAR|nr:hypothetical protein K443DRAFT_5911 [Laccaria amethystina LaAM-08-1]
MDVSALSLTNLRIFEKIDTRLSAEITVSGTLHNPNGSREEKVPLTPLNVYYKGIGDVSVPEMTLKQGPFRRVVQWSFNPADPKSVPELIRNYYTTPDSHFITFERAYQNAPDPSHGFNFQSVFFQGKRHHMIEKVTVHVGPSVALFKVDVDFLFKKPEGILCDFGIKSLSVEAKLRGQVLAVAKHTFPGAGFVISGSAAQLSPYKAITADISANVATLRAVLGKNPVLDIEVKDAEIMPVVFSR